MSGQELAVIEAQVTELAVRREPVQVLAEAHKAALALKDVIERKPKKVMFNGEQYLEFEDWQTIGRFYGITAKPTQTHYVEYGGVHGFTAHAVAIRADGFELSAAEADCLNDEEKWRSRTRYEWRDGAHGREKVKVGEEPVPLFQLKSMAQTRACSKALRNVLAWVVVLAGYRPTPAEELEAEASPEPRGHTGTRTSAPAEKTPQAAATQAGAGLTVADVAVKTGTKNNKPWTRYEVKFSDGTKGSTFDAKLGEQAEAARVSGQPVRPDLVKGEKGTDFRGWLPLASAPEAAPVDEPVNGPEGILTVRKVSTDRGDRWDIQTEKRRLLTDNETLALMATEARKAKPPIKLLPVFEVIATNSGGGKVNKLLRFDEPAAAEREPGAEG
jgi:hypothetical protein